MRSNAASCHARALWALAGHAALHLSCPVQSSAPHLFAFHLAGVLLAAALGVLIARTRRLQRQAQEYSP